MSLAFENVVAKEIVGNSLWLYSVSRNKESFGNVAVGRWKVEVKEAKAFQGILSRGKSIPMILLEMEDPAPISPASVAICVIY